ncbi:MAG: carbohydrate kinase [Planctomycetaceae bacterium]|nr:carbohydrate kinase [Planctomycetaceae bacterium]
MKILAIGEALWDMLPSGRKLGGAPANFAFHCTQLGADARVLSRVGNDDLGRELVEFCRSLGLSTEFIETDMEAPTGTVGVELSADGQPKYTIYENVAWDKIEATDAAVRFAQTADAICFGSLAARSETTFQAIQKLVKHTKPSALRVFDLNLRDPFVDRDVIGSLLGIANVLKLNDEELVRTATMFEVAGSTVQEHADWFMSHYGLKMLILTCGSQGSWIFTEEGGYFCHAPTVEVADTVGAGDAFTAAVVVGVLSRLPIEMINRRANEIASFVCSQNGGTPPHPS